MIIATRCASLSVLVLLLSGTALSAAEIEAKSRIDAVTVYPDGATVTRIIRIDLPRGDSTLLARDFPLALDATSLRVEGAAAGHLVIGSIDASAPRVEPKSPPEVEKEIEALRDERAELTDRIAAQTARKQFAERFAHDAPLGLGEKGEARPIAEWRNAWVAVAEALDAANALIRAAKLRQREIDRDIARLKADTRDNPPRKLDVRIALAADAPMQATLKVSYTVRGARWVPLYDARLDSGTKDRKPELELVRRAEIVQRTGEDWADVALTVSTVRTAKGGSAPDLSPLLVRFREVAPVARPRVPQPFGETRQRKFYEQAAQPNVAGAAGEPLPTVPAEEREATIETGGYQALFRIPGRVTISSGEAARSLRISTAAFAPELLVRTTPSLDETAYLEAAFKQAEEAPLLPGRIAIYRDGIYVGQGRMPLTPKDETVRLGFGADDKVKVSRIAVRKVEGSSGLITTSKVDEREFKITVRNGHAVATRVIVEDRIPVSEVEDVQVELLPVTTAPTTRDADGRRGVLDWSFEVGAGEARDIKLGWRVRWPSGRELAYEQH